RNRFIQTPDGKAGLNYLCIGYKHFFTYCQPFVAEIANILRQNTYERQMPIIHASDIQTISKTGRNDPCPCGSGLKYKKCCGK
ncbi:MAG: uncharacterized protein QG588_998, partial [Candidatus Poribacteria bacterium]|nr:uncharacterized protein [Candidatus Poribacteria bacterium]